GGGKPCAGCVGNADDKNPPGQEPGPSDGNSGYECENPNKDGNNNGIGKGNGNPAHTGCPTQSQGNPPCQVNCGPNPPTHNPGGPGDVILPNVIFRHPVQPDVVRGKRITARGGQLPFTGAALAPILVLGLALVTGGAALSAVRPRRTRRDRP
ncbi:MAG: hypothetical protein ACRDJJ_10320, partial [Actinomycetota bacterium]